MIDKEAMAMALEVLECANSLNRDYENEIAALKERLADPMREVQRLGQEIEQEPPQRTEQEPDDIASIIACRNMLDAQPVPPKVNT